MAFPLSYKSNIQSNYFSAQTEDYNEQLLRDEILKAFASFNFTDLEINQNSFSFFSKNSLISFKYKLDVKIEKLQLPKNLFKVEYEFQTTSLFNITLIITVLSAFISTFSFLKFIIFIILLSIGFYSINIWFVNFLICKAIKTIPIFSTNDNSDNELEKNQMEWLNDTSKCPGCGATVSETDYECSSCGLKLSKGTKYYKNNDSSVTSGSQVEYHYKPSKKR